MKLRTSDGNPWATGAAGSRWLRGNLHCHTTESDGRLSPQHTAEWFAGAGYHFLALTDHNRITDPAQVDVPEICLLPATELSASGGELGATYHLIGLGLAVDEQLPPPATPAVEAARWLRERGAVVFIAHPHWSGLTTADLLAPQAHGIEIYNGGTVLDSQKGEALTHWDEGLARGTRWWGVAVDDTHWHSIDRGLGWIVVRAPELSVDAVLRAIGAGHFYATNGPEIKHVAVTEAGDGGATVDVETSPCAAIYLLGNARNQCAFDQSALAQGTDGATIERASFRVGSVGRGGYVRVQCVDWQRRCAWSNPLFLE